jgi:hypothetical protein
MKTITLLAMLAVAGFVTGAAARPAVLVTGVYTPTDAPTLTQVGTYYRPWACTAHDQGHAVSAYAQGRTEASARASAVARCQRESHHPSTCKANCQEV